MSPHRIINRRNQLLELHVADQVVLVEPLGTADLPETEELPADLLELERRLLIDIEPADAEDEPPRPKRPQPKSRRRATTAQKGARRRSSAPRKPRGD